MLHLPRETFSEMERQASVKETEISKLRDMLEEERLQALRGVSQRPLETSGGPRIGPTVDVPRVWVREAHKGICKKCVFSDLGWTEKDNGVNLIFWGGCSLNFPESLVMMLL